MQPVAHWPATHEQLSPAQIRAIAERVRGRVEVFLCTQQLEPAAFTRLLEPLFVPLAGWLACQSTAAHAPLVGIAGAQGTGKSTLAALLAIVIADGFGIHCANLSLDDLYLTRAERAQLAQAVHPLLRTRGVPGTHDVALGQRVIAALRAALPGQRVALPRFDKAQDERLPEAQWAEFEAPIGCVLFEGWCVGAEPESPAALATPCNALERERDPDARWRGYANDQLAGPYRALFGAIDRLIFLAAPNLERSRSWRTEQEHKLRAQAAAGAATLSDAQLADFVQHYERISRHMLADLPRRADVVLRLGADHAVAQVEVR